MRWIMVLAASAALAMVGLPAQADTVTNGNNSHVENSHHHEFTNCYGLLACVDLLDL